KVCSLECINRVNATEQKYAVWSELTVLMQQPKNRFINILPFGTEKTSRENKLPRVYISIK
ncbi:MAG: hypothetical protein U9P79_04290, partial [Candidatus Cloacimonadota bacterium]|nr:hypothetical protein [Candidatus Cloacimonadota bacterium]